MTAKRKPTRKRPARNVTLSELATEKGEALAEFRGLKFSQFVETLIRNELIKEGRLSPDDK